MNAEIILRDDEGGQTLYKGTVNMIGTRRFTWTTERPFVRGDVLVHGFQFVPVVSKKDGDHDGLEVEGAAGLQVLQKLLPVNAD